LAGRGLGSIVPTAPVRGRSVRARGKGEVDVHLPGLELESGRGGPWAMSRGVRTAHDCRLQRGVRGRRRRAVARIDSVNRLAPMIEDSGLFRVRVHTSRSRGPRRACRRRGKKKGAGRISLVGAGEIDNGQRQVERGKERPRGHPPNSESRGIQSRRSGGTTTSQRRFFPGKKPGSGASESLGHDFFRIVAPRVVVRTFGTRARLGAWTFAKPDKTRALKRIWKGRAVWGRPRRGRGPRRLVADFWPPRGGSGIPALSSCGGD